MIKVTDIIPEGGRMALITAYTDSKDDVTGELTFIGLPYDMTPSAGSHIYTADGDIATLQFDGTWKWMGDEEDSRSLSKSEPISELKKSIPEEEKIEEPEDQSEEPELEGDLNER